MLEQKITLELHTELTKKKMAQVLSREGPAMVDITLYPHELRQIKWQVEKLVIPEVWRHIQTTPDRAELRSQLEAAWQAELERRRAEPLIQRKLHQDKEEEQRRLDIKRQEKTIVTLWRERFPSQCAGFSDDEIWQQIQSLSSGDNNCN